MTTLLVLGGAAVVAGAVAVLVLHVSSALVLSVGIALSVFAGNSKHMGFPLPPDRLVIALGLFLLLAGIEREKLPFRLRFRSQHALMIILAVYATISSIVAGTLFSIADGAYGLLDRLSITAFTLFTVAPLVFHDRKRRNIFLVAMVVLGAYLGATAILEGLGQKALAFPSYINDEAIGFHFDRARGPMTESAGFGLALFECCVCAAVASRQWVGRSAKVTAGIVAAACLAGTLFTLTRAVWIGVVLGILAVCVVSREWRRRLLPAVTLGLVVLFAALSLSPSLSGQVNERSVDQRPVWDRLNLADAGLRIIEEKPLFGIGWRNFSELGPEYYRLLPEIPQTGVEVDPVTQRLISIDIHNAVLSVGAELGLVGLSLWLAVIATTIGAAMFWRPPPELEDWRIGLVAMGVQWAVVAMFTPFSYTFSFLFMWTFAGIVTAHRFVQPRTRPPLLAGGVGTARRSRSDSLVAQPEEGSHAPV
jgi:putative inorganic carbon (HCO3(-)) transporter